MSDDPFGFFFLLLSEGAPDEEIVARVRAIAGDDPDFIGRLTERMKVYRDNLREDLEIPAKIVDDDASYARLRSFAQKVLPRLDRLIVVLSEGSPNN
jgi:hypothetical protein